MNKQEFLAMSLPYGVKILTHEEVTEITAIGITQYQIAEKNISYGWYGDIYNCKPILHPLSDLTKEIEHKGERFNPSYKLGLETISGIEFYKLSNSDLEINIETPNYSTQIDLYSGFLIVQKLIEWHFDLFDGIKNNEAINVNDLETNPYK